MDQQVRFIHAADLHIDSPFKGLRTYPKHILEAIKKSTFDSLERLIETAIEEEVDFVCMTGDIFDQTTQSVYAEITFRRALERLSEKGIHVYLSFGNHDFRQTRANLLSNIEHVHIFSEEEVEGFVFEKDGIPMCKIYGFSYLTQAVTQSKVSGFPVKSSDLIHIGMLHGSYESESEHAHYAPFSIEQLKDKHYDYWALGHIHTKMVLSEDPPIVYSGNIQGRSTKETGERGCFIVDINGHEAKLKFHPLQTIRFEKVILDVTDHDTIDALLDAIMTVMNDFDEERLIIDLQLKNVQHSLANALLEATDFEIIDLLNEEITNFDPWLIIARLTWTKMEEKLPKQDPFLLELQQSFSNLEQAVIMSDLYRHKKASRFLDDLSNEEYQQVKADALRLLVHQLTGGHHHEN